MTGKVLGKSFFDLRGDLESKGIEALRKVANILQELIIKDNGGDGGDQSRGGGEERFGNTGGHGAQAGGTGGAESREGVNDAPDGAEESDEGRNGAGGGEPGHTFFRAADFFRSGQLHIDSDGLKTFQFAAGIRIAGAGGDLALQFAIAERIDGGERRTGGGQGLGVGDSMSSAENAEELVTFALGAGEKAEFLEDHGPRDDGEDEEKSENSTGDPSGLLENATDIGHEERGEQKNGFTPQLDVNFSTSRTVAYAWRGSNET